MANVRQQDIIDIDIDNIHRHSTHPNWLHTVSRNTNFSIKFVFDFPPSKTRENLSRSARCRYDVTVVCLPPRRARSHRDTPSSSSTPSCRATYLACYSPNFRLVFIYVYYTSTYISIQRNPMPDTCLPASMRATLAIIESGNRNFSANRAACHRKDDSKLKK